MKLFFKKYSQVQNSFWNTISAEWKAIRNDKAVISTFFTISFIVLIVYTYVYSNEVIHEVPVAIVNQDNSKASRDYISMLNASDGIKTITKYTDLQEAKTDYFAKKVMGIVIIPNNFGKNIRQGKQTTITTFADASNMIFYKKVLVDVTITTGYYSAGIVIKKNMAKGISMAEAQQNYTPIKTISTSLFNTSSGYATYIIPMLTALIIQLVLLMGIGIINGSRTEDREMLINFPMLLKKGGTVAVLIGKACLYALIFGIILTIQIGIVYTLFSIPIRSSLLLIYLFSIPYIFSVVFLGIAISSLFKRREDAIVFLVLLSIPALMLSGLSFPTEGFPYFYQLLAKLAPSTPGMNGFVKLSQMNASFNEVLTEWNHLWILTGVNFIIAIITLKRRTNAEQLELTNNLK